MKRILALLAIVCLFCSYACRPVWDVRDPEQIRERAEVMRAEAAGFRKDAQDYKALVERSEQQLRGPRTRLEMLRESRKELDERVADLKSRKRALPREEAKKLDITLSRYADKRAALSAKIDDERIRIRILKDQIREQGGIRSAHLKQARRKEREATRLDSYGRKLSGR